MKTETVPRIVFKLLNASRKLAEVDLCKESLCYLVSDAEWRQICKYVDRFDPRDWLPDEKVVTMKFSGIEVIKRSAVQVVEKHAE